MHSIHHYISLVDNCPLSKLLLAHSHLLLFIRIGHRYLISAPRQQGVMLDEGANPCIFIQIRPLRCSWPAIRRIVQGVGIFMLALRNESRANR